jgi:hypothetical protein
VQGPHSARSGCIPEVRGGRGRRKAPPGVADPVLPVAAGPYGHGTVPIGPQRPHPGALQPVDDTVVGMAEGVAAPHGDHRHLRGHRLQQRPPGGGAAPVVSHLQELDGGQFPGSDQERLNLLGGIAGEEGAEVAEAHLQHHGEGVGPVRGSQRVGPRHGVEHPDADAVQFKGLTGPQGPPPHPVLQRQPQEARVETPGRRVSGVGHSPHLDPSEEGLGPSHVIQVGVGQHQEVHPAGTARPEVGEDHPRPRIPGRAPGPGVHHDPAPRRRAEGHRVSLAHVENREPQLSTAPPAGNHRLEEQEHQRSGGHGAAPDPRSQDAPGKPPQQERPDHGSGPQYRHRGAIHPERHPRRCRHPGHPRLHRPQQEPGAPRREGGRTGKDRGEEEREEDPRNGQRHHGTHDEGGGDPQERDLVEVPGRQRGRGEGGGHSRAGGLKGPRGEPVSPAPAYHPLHGTPEEEEPSSPREGELEAYGPRSHGVQPHEDEGRGGECARRMDRAPPDAGDRTGAHEGSGAGGGVGRSDGQDVAPGCHGRHERGTLPPPPGAPHQGVEDPGHHPHVESRNGQQVRRARAGEGIPECRGDPFPAGQDEGLHHGSPLAEESPDAFLDPPPKGQDRCRREGTWPERRDRDAYQGARPLGAPRIRLGGLAPPPRHLHGGTGRGRIHPLPQPYP